MLFMHSNKIAVMYVSLLMLITTANINASSDSQAGASANDSATAKGMTVAGWRMHHLAAYVILCVFVLSVSLLKIGYHHMHYVANYVPESCVLLAAGTIFGVIVKLAVSNDAAASWQLTTDMFFLILLPPIILDSAYSLYDQHFLLNIGSILSFAVLGTVLNFILIGVLLYFVFSIGITGATGFSVSLMHCLLFSSLIVAVDPVAVLAIFQEIGVDVNLYYMVFGESLFNDAVTVVLYTMMKTLKGLPVVDAGQVMVGIVSFFTVSVGGLLVGVIVGVVSCLITRLTRNVETLEPVVLLVCAYFSYIAGDLFEWSGIISMVACGLIQAGYAFNNIHENSLITLKFVTHMIASIGEAAIFLFLGCDIVSREHVWHSGFILWSLAFCLIARTIVTFGLSGILNLCGRLPQIKLREQFIMDYGGLRGAVSFSLALLIPAQILTSDGGISKELFVTTTYVIIFFTTVIMGMTIKPLVKLLDIHLQQKETASILISTTECVMDHLTAGFESVAGHRGYNSILHKLIIIDDKYIRPRLQNSPMTHDEKIVQMFEEVNANIYRATHDAKYIDQIQPVLWRNVCAENIKKSSAAVSRSAPKKKTLKNAVSVVRALNRIKTQGGTQPLNRTAILNPKKAVTDVLEARQKVLEYSEMGSNRGSWREVDEPLSPTAVSISQDNSSEQNIPMLPRI